MALAFGGLVVAASPAAVAAAPPAPTIDVSLNTGDSGKNFILAGEDAVLDVTVRNDSSTSDFNLGVALAVPNGVEYVSGSGVGAPTVYPSGAIVPNSSRTTSPATGCTAPLIPVGASSNFCQVPAGLQWWVFEDVSDLPAGATFASHLTVRPSATTFPSGTTVAIMGSAFVSGDAALRPIFDGSTGIGGAGALADTAASVTDSLAIPVKAVRIFKSEPSPESELLRGVHDNQTTYTLRVETTGQGAVSDLTVVDYLPAGLEFLGCGAVDNTEASGLLYGSGNTAEYPGSGSTVGAAVGGNCAGILTSVETVDSGLPAGFAPGVYTKVTWTIPTPTGVAQAANLSAAGTPGVYEIQYKAAVPLFENTMDFVTTAGTGTPDADSLEQAANLNNNNGNPTRQGQGAGNDDGIVYTNTAFASGTYNSVTATDSDTEDIQAEDLHIVKSVSTGSLPATDEYGNPYFVTGELATYSLLIRTSEYASAGNITVTDVIPDGLCPAFPDQGTGIVLSGDPLPSGCEYPSTAAGAAVSGATVTALSYSSATGEFTVTFSVAALTAQTEHTVSYTAYMRPSYSPDGTRQGSTSSGDSMVNQVSIIGTTTPTADLSDVTNATGQPAGAVEEIGDDSYAVIASQLSSINKEVLARDSVNAAGTDAASICGVSSGWSEDQSATGDVPFQLGDVVCYRLTVDYAASIDVRNPVVTDYLPAGVTYLGHTVAWTNAGSTDPAVAFTESSNGRRLQWNIGDTDSGSGDRVVPFGAQVTILVLGEVSTQTATTSTSLDKPENLMKYQQENVLGEVSFARDASGILLDKGPELKKGVYQINGTDIGPDFLSNVDDRRVVQGDVVRYRIDVATPQATTNGYVIWDALPAGIGKADVVAGSLAAQTTTGATLTTTGTVIVDPGDSAYPDDLNPAYAGRSLVLWTIGGDAPATTDAADPQGLSLFYDVTIPDGSGASDAAEINQNYVNTASIVSYDVVNNDGGETTAVPTGDSAISTTAPTGSEVAVGDAGTVDPSNVRVAAASIEKHLVKTEIGRPSESSNTAAPTADHYTDANNGAGDIVQGEFATFEYSVTVPAHTTVEDGVLSDNGQFTRSGGASAVTYVVKESSWQAPTGVATAGFSFDATLGKLTFPASYQNATNTDQVFVVTIVVRVTDRDASHPAYSPDIANNTTLTNTASFAFDNPNNPGTTSTIQDTASVRYIEPNLNITKSANRTSDVSAADTVTYTLTVTNTTNRPKAYDNVVVDTIPVGLIVDTTSISPAPASYTSGVTTGAGGTITWNLAEVPATATLTYNASIDPTTGGLASYTNNVEVDGYTLPSTLPDTPGDRRGDRTAADSETITSTSASIDKGVRLASATTGSYADSASAPIGETVQYQVAVTLKANINYYDPVITDVLPVGVQLLSATVTGPAESTTTGTITGTWTPALIAGDGTATASDRTLTWTYGGDIASNPVDRTVVITYQVKLANTVAATINSLPNEAAFSWNSVNDTPSSSKDVDDDATVTVLNPVLGIAKTVSNATPNPGETFTYTLTVTNTGNTPAYNLAVNDVVPAGVKVLTVGNGGSITGADPTTGGGGTIAWDEADLPGPLSHIAPDNTVTLTYTAQVIDSPSVRETTAPATGFTNTASVTHFESFDDGGREYNPTDVRDTEIVNPRFPLVTLDKTVTNGSTAYADESFSWTLTLVNTGDGQAQSISVTDVLPKNWEYDAGSASISRGGAAAVSLADPTVTDVSAVQTLNWSAAQISSTTPALPGTGSGASLTARTIVITFTATPTSAAITDAGVGATTPHTNTLSAVVTDTSGATENGDGPYAGPDDTADAFLGEADLHIVKTATGGTTTGTPTGQWVAGRTAGTGYAQPQWTIVVTNQGPDDSYGPFAIVDTLTTPAGVSTGAFTARYYASAADTTGTALTITGTGTAGSPYVVGTTGTSLKADGSDRIVLVADVTITAAAVGTAQNSASVTGRTYESDDNIDKDNTDDDSKDLTTVADLTIVKSNTLTAVPNAGGSVTWTLTPSNLGPSVSQSTADDPITITDTIPDGINGVTVDPGTDWTASVPGGFPADAGDVVTFTYTGSAMPVGQAGSITLTGTIDPAWVVGSPAATITNEAEIHEGPTTDPDQDNNSDDDVVTPTADTTIDASKVRVVAGPGGTWVPATEAAIAGEDIHYLITVANLGSATARDVVVTDNLPTGLTYESTTNVVGTWTRTGASTTGLQTFTLTGAIDPLGSTTSSASFVVTVSTDPSITSAVTNCATPSASNAPAHAAVCDDSSSTVVFDLGIVKTRADGPVTPDTVVAGTTVPYRLTITSNGPSTSVGEFTVTDTLPAGLTYADGTATVTLPGGGAVAAVPTVTADATGRQVLTWAVGDGSLSLAPGQTVVIELVADIDAAIGAGTTLHNDATVAKPGDSDPSNNASFHETTVTTSATFTIVKDVEPGPWVAGTEVEYTLTVTNNGPSAIDATVTDVLPAGLTLVSLAGATGWTCTDATQSCVFANHPVGAGAATTITVTARIESAVVVDTLLTNTATVTWEDSTGPGSDDDDADITVSTIADLELVKTAVDADGKEITTANAGEQVRYQFAVHNYGTSDAAGPLTIVDPLPAGLSYAGIADDGGVWSAVVDPADPQLVTFTRSAGLVAGGDAEPLIILATVDAALAPTLPGDDLVNTATVTSLTPEPPVDPHPNTDTADIDVTRLVDLVVVKTHAEKAHIGDDLTFDVAVSNNGPSAAENVVVTDTLPAGLEYVDSDGSDAAWTVTAAAPASDGTTVITATLAGPVAAAALAPTLRITATVLEGAYPQVTNVATVTGSDPESDTSNNRSEDPVPVPPLAKLTITKDAVGTFKVGEQGTYRITVTNAGPTQDPGPLVITDQLPAGLEFVAAATADGVSLAQDGQKLTFTTSDPLAVGASIVITLTVKVTEGAYPSVTNVATVSTPTELVSGSTLTDSATIAVTEADKLTSPLPWTGSLVDRILPLGALLLAAGAGVLAIVRRRKHSGA